MGMGNPFCMQYDHTSQRARERGGGRKRKGEGGGREREGGGGREVGGGEEERERERTRKPGRKAKIVDESGLQSPKKLETNTLEDFNARFAWKHIPKPCISTLWREKAYAIYPAI